MSHCRRAGWVLVASVLAVAGLTGSRLRAAELHAYDPDSLVHLSTDVVEAEIVRAYKGHDLDLVDVRVSLVHKGGIKAGQTVVVAHTDFYHRPGRDPINTEPLGVGDRLALFLARTRSTGFRDLPADAVVYSPLPGGVRLVRGGNVHEFSQQNNPGPYVADIPADAEKAKLVSLDRFRAELRTSLRVAPELAKVVDAAPDAPRLLELLDGRSRVPRWYRDHFAEAACSRLTETRAPEVLDRALPLARDHLQASILRRGFGTPTGRDFLLAKAGETRVPMADRVDAVRALREAGHVYRATVTEITAHSSREVGGADRGNSGYMTRVAKAARANAGHETLCVSLVGCLDAFGQGVTQSKRPPLLADYRAALAELKDLYGASPSAEVRFAVEGATARDPAAFERLDPPCGTFVSILRRADPTKYTRPEKRSLIFEYEYTTLLLDREDEVRPEVVLVNQATRRRHVLPAGLRLRGWSSGGGSGLVDIPADLPAGRYRVFFQVTEDGRVTSTGHSFDTDL